MAVDLRVNGTPTRTEEQIYKDNIKLIDVSKIYIKSNVREEYSDIDDLKESLKKHGLLQSITVIKDEDGFYYVLTGNRRYKAFKSLFDEGNHEFVKIPCIVHNSLDELKTIEIQLVENIQRDNLKEFEVAKSLKRLKEETGKFNEDIGKMIGKSEKWVVNHLKALEIIETIKTSSSSDIGTDNITINQVLETKNMPEDKQLELLNAIIQYNLTIKEIRSIKDMVMNNPNTTVEDEVLRVIFEKEQRDKFKEVNKTTDTSNINNKDYIKFSLKGSKFNLPKRSINNISEIKQQLNKYLDDDIMELMEQVLNQINNGEGDINE